MTAPGAPARRKGHTFERDIARLLGVRTTRNFAGGAHEDRGDLVLPGWMVELKNQARWSIPAWWAVLEAKGYGTGDDLALIVKRPGLRADKALVVVEFDWWKEKVA